MNPSKQTEKNIRAIYESEKLEREKIPSPQKIARAIADFVGTVRFAVLSMLVFSVWIGVNLTFWKFDPYPFTLLVTIVSLEAIFLSIVVLISQNELSKQQDRRNLLDLQVNLLAEQESTELIKVVLLIAGKMGIDKSELAALEAMAEDTEPGEVLRAIDNIEKEDS